MFFLRKIRSLFKILNSALSPNQVATGFCLGILMGFPPLGLHSLMLLLVALLVNISFSATLLAFAFFKLFSWILFPLSYEVGKFVLESVPFLEPVWTTIFNLPVLAVLEYNNYVVLGSYILALLFTIPAFFMIRKFVRTYRDSFFKYLESRKSYQSLQRRERIHRSLEWVLMGGGARFKEMKTDKGIFSLFRKSSIIILPMVVGLILLVVGVLSTLFIDRVVLGASSAVVGGEVSAEKISMDAFSGRIVMSVFSVQDPNNQTNNIIEIGEIVTDISYLDLLSKRFVFNEVGINEITFNLVREADGSLNIEDVTSENNAVDLTAYFDWLKNNADKIDWLKIIVEYLRARIDEFEFREDRGVDGKMLSQYKYIDSILPWIAVEQISIERVHVRLEDHYQPDNNLPQITMIDLILQDVELPVSKARDPVQIGLRAHINGDETSYFEVSALLDNRSRPPREEYRIKAERIDLAMLNPVIGSSIPVLINTGLGYASAEIVTQGDRVEAVNEIRLDDLSLSASGTGISLWGIPQDLTTSTLRGINAYASRCPVLMGLSVNGTTEDLQFVWEDELLRIAKQGLIMEGGRFLSEDLFKIDQQLDIIGEQLGGIEIMQDSIEGLLGRIFGSNTNKIADCDL